MESADLHRQTGCSRRDGVNLNCILRRVVKLASLIFRRGLELTDEDES